MRIKCGIIVWRWSELREKSLIDIYILEILEKYSSSKNRLNQKDIICYLDKDYNIKVSRNVHLIDDNKIVIDMDNCRVV